MAVALNQTIVDQNLTTNASTDPGNSEGSPLIAVIGLTLANISGIICGTLGNALVVVTVVVNRGMRSTTNFFIASLAAADLLVTSTCMPLFFVYNVLTWPVWPFGTMGCRILSYLVHMSVMASALSLLAISYDRFLSVFFPLKRFITTSHAKKIVAFIWFVSPPLLIPSLFHHDIVSTTHQGKPAIMCVESWSTARKLHTYQMYRISCYFLFLLQISVLYILIGRRLYTRQQPGEQTSQSKAKAMLSKRKVIKMLFLVVAMFALCWLPYIINKLLTIFPPKPNYQTPDVFVFVGNFLGLLNSVANPLIYAVLNQNFRTAFKNALRCKCNYEVEARRRAISKASQKSTMKTQRSRCESLMVDRHRSSLSSADVGVVSAGQIDLPANRVRCLSFSSIDRDVLVGYSNTVSNQKNSNEVREDSDKRRVSFGEDPFDSTDAFDQDKKPSGSSGECHSEMEETNHGTDGGQLEAKRRCETSISHLSPIFEKGYSNESFKLETIW